MRGVQAVEKYYSTEDIAEILGLKEKTVREWLRTGKLKGKKIGRLWRVKESELEEFINEPPAVDKNGDTKHS
jgi:excisionase family DNA binding protein